MKEGKLKILFVCTGNICRSPLAHKLFEKMAIENNCEERFEVDSCGTHSGHIGSNADLRMRKLAQAKGWSFDKYSRQINRDDMRKFDYVFVMDRGHMSDINHMFKSGNYSSKVVMFRKYDYEGNDSDIDVPDPYYGGNDGFKRVYDMIERTCRNIIDVYT